VVWSRFPRTGIPPDFTSYGEFENYVELLVKTNSIDDGKRIWWDLRPHHIYPTLEFRICDACTKIEETICLAALIQAVCAKLLKLRKGNLGFRKYLPNLVAENKWRAMRRGIDAKLIDFGKQAEVPYRDLAEELCEFVDDVLDELDSRPAVDYIHTILAEGTSADRQLKVYEETGSLVAVVDRLCEETVAAPGTVPAG
jgi:carboxylate-amine ligase